MSSFAHSLEYEPQNDAEWSKMAPNRCRTQQNGTKSMQNAANWPQIDADRSKLREHQSWTEEFESDLVLNVHFLENEPRIDAERGSSLPLNPCRTQQSGRKSTRSAPIWHHFVPFCIDSLSVLLRYASIRKQFCCVLHRSMQNAAVLHWFTVNRFIAFRMKFI